MSVVADASEDSIKQLEEKAKKMSRVETKKAVWRKILEKKKK
jgi:hypothetical protein